MKVLVWQWGKRGAGPRFAAELAAGFRGVPDVQVLLSLSAQAELLTVPDAPDCDLPVPTYRGAAGLLRRVLTAPVMIHRLAAWLRRQQVDVAICAMPAPLDLVMAAALRRARIPYAVIVHDAELHPGDIFALQVPLQRRLMAGAAGLLALTRHVADRLQALRLVRGRPLSLAWLPPFRFGPAPPPLAHGGALRLLSFGRLLPYKGLDLLADALTQLGARPDLEVRVVGSGPESPALTRLRALPRVHVENRWVPEAALAELLAWSDALVLPYREASQSGIAAAAIAAGRWVVATRVGGLAEQLADAPMAVLCEPTTDGLAAALLKLLSGEAGPAIPPADPAKAWTEAAAVIAAGLREILGRR